MERGRQIAVIVRARRIWAIGSVHGEAERLARIHDEIGRHVGYGDRVVYLGNYLGHGAQIRETVGELLRFRRHFLSIPPYTDPADVVFLRGAQEEMWQKLLQLQFAVRSREVLEWMLPRGLEATIRAFGGNPAEAFSAADRGTMALTAWTSALREAARSVAGHMSLMGDLRHAAVSGPILFVNAGIDTSRALAQQTDAFWWAGRSFADDDAPYGEHRLIVRGFDPQHGGYQQARHRLTVDGGAGFGGTVSAVCLAPDGEVLSRFEA